MAARIVQLDHGDPARSFASCRETIGSGGVIAYPTDTFYGLGADPRDRAAVERLFRIKERRPDQPILLLLSGVEEVPRWARPSAAARMLMERYWPGPLTLVMEARETVLPELTAGTGTIGLRVPGNAATRELLRFLGTALTGTSANRSGRPEPRTAAEVAASLGPEIDLVLDGGPATADRPSTIIDASGDAPRVLRPGVLTIEFPLR